MHISEMTCLTCCHGGAKDPLYVEMFGVVDCTGSPRWQYITLDVDEAIEKAHPFDLIKKDPREHYCSLGLWQATDRPFNRYYARHQGSGFGREEE